MKIIQHIPPSIFFCIILLGCEMVAEVAVPAISDRLVVHGVLRPDSNIVVHVNQDVNVLQSSAFGTVNDANVTIKLSTGSTFQGIYENGYYYFGSDLTVTPLIRYELEVSAPGFETINAISEIPFKVPIERAEIIWPPKKFNFLGQWYEHNITQITFTDPPYSKNYYRFMAYIQVIGQDYQIDSVFDANSGQYLADTLWDQTKEVIHYEPIPFEYKTDVILDPEQSWESFNHITFNDELIDGQQYTLDVPLQTYYLAEFGQKFQHPDMDEITAIQALLILSSMNEALYDYYTTASLQQANTTDIFSQPIQIKSNINNGFGVFGGENLTYFLIENL